MRPYLAIIKDSFREALASRVLWVFSGLITLVLLALAPIGYRLNLRGELTWGEITDGPQLVERLRREFVADQASPGRRIWSLLDDEAREILEKLEGLDDPDNDKAGAGREYSRGMEALRKGLNTLIVRRDFYREEDWTGVPLPKEASEYLARPRDSLSSTELARLNRLLIESPFQSCFAWRSPESVSVTYFWLASDPLPFSKKQVDNVVKEWILTQAMGWIVGVFGIIAAILVTSTVVPQMFEPGSITLLLSKPVSRSLLFTTKVLGACAFVLLNVTLLIVGLWLISGLRLGIWNQGMLSCIPIFLFMFLIYYAVSALTGLIWKSAVISVVLTVVFYVACWLVDTTHELARAFIIEQNRITRIAMADDSLLTVTEGGRLQSWNDEGKTWLAVAEPQAGRGIPTLDGPFFHAPSKQLVVGQGSFNPFGARAQRVSLKVAAATSGWQLRDGPAVPGGTAALLLTSDDTLLAIASDNIFSFRGDLASKATSLRFLGMSVPLVGGGEFRPMLSGRRPELADPIAAAADPQQPRIVVCAANTVHVFAQQAAGSLGETARQTLDSTDKEGAAVAIAGDLVVVAREEGKVLLLSSTDLSLKQELSLEPQSQPRFVAASRDGKRIAVLFQNHYLWFIDSQTGVAGRASLASQGEISGFAWTPNRLLTADYANRVVSYDLETLTPQQVYRPALSRYELAYYYVVHPLHIIFPKPRLLNNTVRYVLTGKRTTDVGLFQGNVSQQREDLHPWRPVRSGLAFVGVLLLAACVYIERHEF